LRKLPRHVEEVCEGRVGNGGRAQSQSQRVFGKDHQSASQRSSRRPEKGTGPRVRATREECNPAVELYSDNGRCYCRPRDPTLVDALVRNGAGTTETAEDTSDREKSKAKEEEMTLNLLRAPLPCQKPRGSNSSLAHSPKVPGPSSRSCR